MFILSAERRKNIFNGLLIAAILAHALINILSPHVFGDGDGTGWKYLKSVPTALSLGKDLNDFLSSSKTMFSGKNPFSTDYNSPPFTAIIFYPLTLVSESYAYRFQLILLTFCNIVSLVLLAVMIKRSLIGQGKMTEIDVDIIIRPVLFTLFVFQFFGYPFEFALERGNYDSYGLMAIVLGLWFVDRPRWSLWLPVLFFSLAAHLKVYPAIFLIIPLWQHKLRGFIACGLVNCVMLCSFGLTRAKEFFFGLYHYSMTPYFWTGNHSGPSFVNDVFESHHLLRGYVPESWSHPVGILIAVGVPLALWLHGTIRLVIKGLDSWACLLWAALATPIMCIVPSTSHDYKLVIMVIPAFICLIHFSVSFLSGGGARSLIAIVTVLVAVGFIARSTIYRGIWLVDGFWYMGNKYPIVFLFELCAYVAILQHESPTRNVSNQETLLLPVK